MDSFRTYSPYPQPRHHVSSKPEHGFWTSPRNGAIGGTLLLTLLVLGAYAYFSPYITLWRMREAAQAKDGKAFASYIDFPVLKENLKSELSSYMTRDPSLKDNPFAGVGVVFANGLVETLVTPATVEKVLSGEPLFRNLGNGSKPSDAVLPSVSQLDNVDWSYASPNEFQVSLPGADGAVFTLSFERHWIGDWKLSGIKLPPMPATAPPSYQKPMDSEDVAMDEGITSARALPDTDPSAWVRYFTDENSNTYLYNTQDYEYRGTIAVYWVGVTDRAGRWKAFMHGELNCYTGWSRFSKAVLPDGTERPGIGWMAPGAAERAMLPHVCSQFKASRESAPQASDEPLFDLTENDDPASVESSSSPDVPYQSRTDSAPVNRTMSNVVNRLNGSTGTTSNTSASNRLPSPVDEEKP